MPRWGSGVCVCSSSLLIRGPILPAVRQKLHLSPCSDFRSRLCRHQRRAPIGMPVVALVIDRAEHFEGVAYTVIELSGDAVQLLVVAVDEAVDLRRTDVESIVESRQGRAAARTEMRAIGAERIDGGVELVPDRAGGRLPAHIIDRA